MGAENQTQPKINTQMENECSIGVAEKRKEIKGLRW